MIRKFDDRLFLVGVAHVLPSSIEDVKNTISGERPDIVAVELDSVRYQGIKSGTKPTFADFARAGPNALFLGTLLSLTQDKFSKQTGIEAGEEMLVAVDKAVEAGVQVAFIDQFIGVTMQRLAAMPLREKMALFGQLVLGLLSLGGESDLGNITEEQTVARLLSDFKRLSKTAYRVLIDERDDYMAQRLADLLASGKKTVAVVGAGHVPGIYDRLTKLVSGSWSISYQYGHGS